ncbi:unnamed protein product [Moneuplotes crassus]|uniref:Rab-GAP TBC domain-containing protein n=1 Tax=Euplotes crassus TaxID=5936 RepID=A0AAD2D4Q3_EUPCR|nr:unnamed protein product [Moneuplotes crassus]
MSNLSIPSTLSFPLIDVDTNDENILILDHSQTLWDFKDIISSEIQIKKVIDQKVRNFKCWGDKVIIYIENNELLQVSLDTFECSPIKPGFCISVNQIACGQDHCLIVTRSGYVYSYGSGEFGQLGNDNDHDQSEPNLILNLSNCRVSKIACTDHASFAVARAKDFKLLLQNSKCDIVNLFAFSEPDKDILFSWGRGAHGCLATGDCKDRLTPTITDVTISSNIKDIQTGSNHCVVLLEDDCVYSWGSNSHGQLGRSMYVEKESTSRKVPNLERVNEIFASNESSGCRLIEDDKLFVWGKLDSKEEVCEYEPIERKKWKEVENHKFIYTGFYDCHLLTATSKIGKMLSGDFLRKAAKSASPRPSPSKDDSINNENTLDFINLSLNKADQRRKIAYHPEGIPKSFEEEKRHRELVYQTKKKYIESLKKVEEQKNASKNTGGSLKDQIRRERDDKLVIWEKVFEQSLPNFDNIIRNMNHGPSNNSLKGEHITKSGSDAEEFRKFWIQGVPEKIRAKVWARVTGNPSFITPKFFEILWKRGMRLKESLERQELINNSDIPNQSSDQEDPEKPKVTEETVEGIKNDLINLNKDIEVTKEKIEELNQLIENSKDAENIVPESDPKPQLDKMSEKLTSLIRQRADLSIKLDVAMKELPPAEAGLTKEHSLKTINGDIPRTFSKEHVFKSEVFSKTMNKVLTAYAMYRPDIGYVQGMSYILGIICLLSSNEYEAFLLFHNIVMKANLLPFFSFDDVYMKQRIVIFKQIFGYNCQDLCFHFEDEGIQPSLYLYQWFMSLFAKALNMDITCRIWDLLLIDGVQILYKTSIALLVTLQEDLIESEFDEIMQILRNTSKKITDEDEFVETVLQVSIPEWIDVEITFNC